MGNAPDTPRMVTLSGGPRDRGLAYGEEVRGLIEEGLDRWKETLAEELKTDPDDYLRRFLRETSFVPAIEEWTPWVLAEIRGLAEGANVPFELMLAYNLPDEEWWYRGSAMPEAANEAVVGGCSVIGVREGPNGAPIAAQNMDVPVYYGSRLLITFRDEDGHEVTVLGYAGSTGLCGCNREGLSICCNTLLTLPHSERGLPVNCVVRGVLAQTTLGEARAFVESVQHASGQAYLIGGPNDLFGAECGAGGCSEYGAGAASFWHTNHPLVAAAEPTDPEAIEALSETVGRGKFLSDRIESIRDVEGIEAALSDRTVPICKVPTSPRGAITFGSIIMELTVPPRLRLAAGPPDRTGFEDLYPMAEAAAT